MTDYYVDASRTGGSNNGTSWANAWLSVNSATGLTEVDRVFVASGHQETFSVSTNMTGQPSGHKGGPTFISVDETGDPEPPGVTDYETMDTGGGYIRTNGGAYYLQFVSAAGWHGITFKSSSDFYWGTSNYEPCLYRDCIFEMTAVNTHWRMRAAGTTYFENCTFKAENSSSDTAGGIEANNTGMMYFVKCTWANHSYKTYFIEEDDNIGPLIFIGCDLTTYGNLTAPVLLYGNIAFAIIKFIGCKLPTDADFSLNTNIGWNGVGALVGIDCDAGNGYRERSFKLSFPGIFDTWGGSDTSREVYRSGGYTPADITNPICWKVLAADMKAKTQTVPFKLFPLSIWNNTTGATVTVTVEFLLGDATAVDALDNDEIWMRVDYYDTAGSTLLKSEWTRPSDILVAPTAISTSAASWTTTDGETNTTAYKLTHTTASNVARKGPIQVEIFIGDPGTNDAIYVDPMITLS